MIARTLLALTLGFSLSASAAPVDDVNALLKSLNDAFSKSDAKAAAALFAEDGDVINPVGAEARGRAAIEKLIANDMATILKGTTNHKFTTEIVRELAPTAWLVDATQSMQNMKLPDGKTGTGKLHVVFALSKASTGKLQIVSARPYMFMPKPTQQGMGK